jgi:DNA-binding MarR family transcriptional regulator
VQGFLPIDDLPRGVSKLRNRVIGRVFHALGLSEQLGSGVSMIAAAIRLSPRATRTRLARLVGRGLVREIGTGPQDPRRRYFLAEQGRP